MVYVLIIVFYLIPLVVCYFSVASHYSKGGIGEDENIEFWDIAGPMIPLLNIYAAIMSFFTPTKKSKPIRRYSPPPRPRSGWIQQEPLDPNFRSSGDSVSERWVKEKFLKEKEEDSIGIKFNFKK